MQKNQHIRSLIFLFSLLMTSISSFAGNGGQKPSVMHPRSLAATVGALAAVPMHLLERLRGGWEHAPDEASTTYEPSTNENNGVDSAEGSDVSAFNGGHSVVSTYLSSAARSRPSAFDDAEEEDQERREQNRRLNTNVMSSIETTLAVHMQRTIEFLLAACHGQLEELKRLLSQGVDIKEVDHQGFTALHIAASNGHLEVLKYLLSQEDSDIHAEDIEGHTALHVSAQGGHLEVVKHLQPHGSILGANTLLAAYKGASGIDFIRSMINEDIGAVLSNLGPKPNMYENNRAAVLIQKILLEYFIEAMD